MKPPTPEMIIDYRERASGIPEILKDKLSNIGFKNLNAGDYLIPHKVLVERKTAVDLIQSLKTQVLFGQCKKLKNQSLPVLMIIEGNPLRTTSMISKTAVKGALLSITSCWQIPVYYTATACETANTIVKIVQHEERIHNRLLTKGTKPKRLHSHQLFFVQGLPGISKKLSYDLLKEFRTIEKVLFADCKSLQKIRGIGKTKAQKIHDFLHQPFEP
ncbi:MAG: hypothetical protein K9G67_00145 [Bacteroidales bacterium]|nr:hypothetical protein [Bacteroidales bacterium]MCF8343775.1 hypothetical protein [Bacteroidales bacterium]MCF8350301.1 hypothetical protein [Bacteroidales bacterium]MCF8374740.1 hypothetical protein [Bacteroidales bacterium]MCF8399856.1 hypothetical protein [Bacteroidales bacterium]